MFQKDINRLNEKAYLYAKSVPIKDALILAGYTGNFKRRGNSLFFQCPNGCDEKGSLDKCCINLNENLAHCFGCGDGWDSSRIVSLIKDIPYNHASIFLAKDGGVISDEEYDEITQAVNYKKMVVGNVRQIQAEKRASEVSEYRRPDKECDLVYRHLLQLKELQLTQEHWDYLHNIRHLTNEEIQTVGYFTYDTTFKMSDLLSSIRREQPDFKSSALWGVAGFYMVFTNKEKTSGYWTFRSPYKNCIGIPLRNANGEIVALQMRSLNENMGNKYFFVSSKGYKEKGKEVGYGTTCGTPAHVEYPKVITNSLFMISEGQFKVHEMAKEGSICFSCQGVNNYQYVIDEIEKCLNSQRFQESSKNLCEHKPEIAICYDADMYKTVQVLNASLKFCNAIQKKFPEIPLHFLLWDLQLGKGFDDMKANCIKQGISYHQKCFMLDAETFCMYATESISIAKSRYEDKHGIFDETKMYSSDEFKSFLYQELWVNRLASHQH